MIGVDVGGTFTDIISVEGGAVRAYKVPTEPGATHRSVLAAADLVDLSAAAVFNHASTHGLNAILTRQVPKIAFLTTAGHRDMLDMAQSWRPPAALTDMGWRRTFGDSSAPIVPRYLRRGILERIQATGEVYLALDEEQARAELALLAQCQVDGVAICLINSYINNAHEERLVQLVAEVLGDIPCSVSSRVSPLAREYTRASTTVIDVVMKVIYAPYTSRLQSGLADAGFNGQLNFADCAAQLLPAADAMKVPSRVVFSGPSAGVVSAAYFGELIGTTNLVCADVGGTSCDIGVVRASRPSMDTTLELEHDLVVNTLSTSVHAIGAGGGSIVSVTHAGEIQVGPRSAGADPGPACYGKGGTEPTVTDACLLIGILDPDRFAGGKLDADAARHAFEELSAPGTVDQRISFAYRIAITNIAEGVFNELVKAGVDPRDYDLIAYGAAGPMLLPATLDMVHVRSVVIPPNAGLFSAAGLLSSDRVFTDSRTLYSALGSDVAPALDRVFRELESGLLERLGTDGDEIELVRSFDGRLLGQFWETPFVPVPAGSLGASEISQMVANFHDVYEARWGGRFDDLEVQGVTYRVSAVLPTAKIDYPIIAGRDDGSILAPRSRATLRHMGEEAVQAEVYERTDLRAGDAFEGPAIIREELGTTHIHEGQRAQVGKYGEIRISRATRANGEVTR
jgi:N-methylhydantoinase A